MRKNSEDLREEKKLCPLISLPDFCPPSFTEKLSTCRLGPGTYNITLNTFSGPAHQFSQSSRFKESDPYAKYFKRTRKSSSINLLLPKVNLDIFRAKIKDSLTRQSGQSLSQKLLDTKLTKTKIQQVKKLNLLKILKEKDLKYQLRQRVKVFKPQSAAIQILLVIFTANLSIITKGKLQLIVKRRVRKLIKIFTYSCRALGKFKSTLRKARIFQSYRILKKFAVHIKNWLNKRKKFNTELINNSINLFMKKPLLHKIAQKLYSTIKSIQIAWKQILVKKNVALNAKLRIFRFFERSYSYESANKYLTPAKKFLVLKELVRLRFKKLIEYIRNLRRHKKNCERIDKRNKKTMFRYGLNQKKSYKLEKYPPRPYPCYTISKSTYISLIQYLQSHRSLLS